MKKINPQFYNHDTYIRKLQENGEKMEKTLSSVVDTLNELKKVVDWLFLQQQEKITEEKSYLLEDEDYTDIPLNNEEFAKFIK